MVTSAPLCSLFYPLLRRAPCLREAPTMMRGGCSVSFDSGPLKRAEPSSPFFWSRSSIAHVGSRRSRLLGLLGLSLLQLAYLYLGRLPDTYEWCHCVIIGKESNTSKWDGDVRQFGKGFVKAGVRMPLSLLLPHYLTLWWRDEYFFPYRAINYTGIS